ncbi:5314_t:CDS:1, partial [Rhizophagus irregularis]
MSNGNTESKKDGQYGKFQNIQYLTKGGCSENLYTRLDIKYW